MHESYSQKDLIAICCGLICRCTYSLSVDEFHIDILDIFGLMILLFLDSYVSVRIVYQLFSTV